MQVHFHTAMKRTSLSRGWRVIGLMGMAALTVTSLSLVSIGGANAASPMRSQFRSGGFPVLSKSQIKIAIVAGGPNVYFSPWAKATVAAAKALGVTVTDVVAPTPTFEPAVEASTIDSLVAKGYNAFGIFPDGEASIIPVYNRLIARGIPVIDLAGCTTSPTPALFCMATNVKASADYETTILIKAMGGKGNIAFLTGLLTDPNTIQREDGVKEAVAASKGAVKLVQVVSNIDSPSAAPPAVESLLASKGTELQGMLSTDYYPSVAAASVLTANPMFRHIVFIGQDNDAAVMSAIAKKAIYGTMYQNSYGQAYVGATFLEKILADGCKVQGKGFISALGADKFINSGYFFVGQSDVSHYKGLESIPSVTNSLVKDYSQYLACP